MAFVVVYDANVLYRATLRDVLIRVALAGLVQAKWTDEILDETFGKLKANRTDLDPARLDRTRERMNAAVRDCLATGYKRLIDAVELPDPKDRHVLAAAIRARAQVIVTFNLKHFPSDVLAAWDIEPKHPDDFLIDQFHLDAITVHHVVQAIADSRANPPGTADDVLDELERSGLPQTAAVLRR